MDEREFTYMYALRQRADRAEDERDDLRARVDALPRESDGPGSLSAPWWAWFVIGVITTIIAAELGWPL